ncbi:MULTISPECIES: glycoside hydrolase family 32 protein [Glutamicibacter]|uniref:Glycoside hydrolase family 32 protein n=1 Tax=Glutamicibacter halophytocola TaxID=1933880 RepID=A0AA94XTL9_9MICC|nr:MULTISPECIES: glycoside hydrolase family 32 protein [Glutamicibacter]MBF6672852.1 glycoside hydrolase family 32 protein [Glutamicibacter sp. FBE19]UUX57947.1 glycoside hydrolase family 32 protein [Glutamicibacter halophytocola]
MPKTQLVAVKRPQLHFTAKKNWINDPNGLFFDGKQYHMYFQHNPNGVGHGYMSWGHAVSTDLVNWEELPIAILHGDVADIFSGSIVVDHENTSGFGDGTVPPVIAIYTAAAKDESNQSQAIAYSLDGGETFTKYEQNPVLDRGSKDFRDPKVIRYESERGSYWVMVAVEAIERRVLVYRSENFKDWTELSSFGPQSAIAGIWECPDLFQLPVAGTDQLKWVLIVSLNPGGVAGGSGTQYFIGEFDGTSFTPDQDQQVRDSFEFESLKQGNWLDWGRDFYAGVSFHGLPADQQTVIAWMSNWDYARELPHDGWRGSMSTARRLDLVKNSDGKFEIRQCILGLPASEVAASVAPAGEGRIELGSPALLELAVGGDANGSAALSLFRADDTLISELTIESELIQHRRETGKVDHELYASNQRMPLPADTGELTVQVLVDHGSVEILAANGLRSLTDQLTGEEAPAYATLRVATGASVTFKVLPLSDKSVELNA